MNAAEAVDTEPPESTAAPVETDAADTIGEDAAGAGEDEAGAPAVEMDGLYGSPVSVMVTPDVVLDAGVGAAADTAGRSAPCGEVDSDLPTVAPARLAPV